MAFLRSGAFETVVPLREHRPDVPRWLDELCTRCLAADPKYLLLDEPFAGVDPISVGDIRHLVADLTKRGIGVLITDHNVRETLDVVDRAYILHEGKILMSGTPDEVVENENVRRVYLGDKFRMS